MGIKTGRRTALRTGMRTGMLFSDQNRNMEKLLKRIRYGRWREMTINLILMACATYWFVFLYKFAFYCKTDSPLLVGKFNVNVTPVKYTEVANKIFWISSGGHYKPNCTALQNVAIIIPFRNRENQLAILMNNLHSILYRQQIEYTVYVVEQADNRGFNKGKLYNVGYTEAVKRNHDCFVFHDVDLIPENDNILYGCIRSPMHLSRAIDKFNYKLPDKKLIGGVSAWRKKEFEMVNGWSNVFINWGGEDDDMSYRITANGLKIYRFQNSISRYKMLRHPQAVVNTARFTLLEESFGRYKTDGLSSLRYVGVKITEFKLFTKISVSL
ncbi:beta-1,4-N-acetylgalactosaminyltransferase bre-4-like [Saccostrea cucullata]|uniref:beta-1,4-N-acetylgalactosaminyltransferase bre-4-like n=1 Tax=Saccostrea cuccullata TaxID=36930 RepID=UPI002ED1EF96